ncbi:endonuclease MutS2 [Nonlabens ulvanivorans]|uniref:DNA mismatch repair protein MutS n=1 Tax=Nonlabens ulvanivorans TaxID=906888 RepID=A0A084K049_NONUL|nr:DNA mismatch repair protein MutS [Nonlabens ulvanivorans]KEZ94583.1 DNA mismatch repair protein MutS [Nonlabens ulvanivorans]PRX12495.1 DNA mismatch repair protein MutS2 [Nonlabens ulvanivorans]
MSKISNKTIQDLEFNVVLDQASSFCTTTDGKKNMLLLEPLTYRNAVKDSLQHTNEYLQSYASEYRIPNHGFDPIEKELQLLGIENSTLEKDSIRKLAVLPRTVNEHLTFFKKQQLLFPKLFSRLEKIEKNEYVPQAVDAVLDRFGEVKDDASPDLKNLRREMNSVKGQLNGSFGAALSHYSQMDYLDEIRETVIENRRVLAVKAMYRRKVKGKVMGSSKTGSISYIEPERVLTLSRKLAELEIEEAEEIHRILKALTETLRPFLEEFKIYRDYLTHTDIIAAKSRYAQSINALLPIMVEHRELELVDAYHPLLLVSNRARNEKTYPQTIGLKADNRIIVISGPNAGGKSITLKTIGLLQLMIQAGFLIPVHEKSRMSIFKHVLTDIGDNQSIDNHLSTYSYRLKNMRGFLKKADDKTLFLIDEFGTGSDPELGGALAESMLEELYSRKSFGIITTHYTNLKMLANELPEMTNANMLFDAQSLEPIYKLQLGEAGSSFTFEVAQKNGIPYSLINKAKKKVERGKIRFDKSIAALQKERSNLRKNNEALREREIKATQKVNKLDDTQDRVQQKLLDFQEMYDSYQRYIQLGKKFDGLAKDFSNNKKKKLLVDELMKMVITENVKRQPAPKKTEAKKHKQEQGKKKQLENEVIQKVAKIREQKKKNPKPVVAPKPKVTLKKNDRVRLLDSKSVGTIDQIEKGKATVNYGMFTTIVSVEQLEKV